MRFLTSFQYRNSSLSRLLLFFVIAVVVCEQDFAQTATSQDLRFRVYRRDADIRVFSPPVYIIVPPICLSLAHSTAPSRVRSRYELLLLFRRPKLKAIPTRIFCPHNSVSFPIHFKRYKRSKISWRYIRRVKVCRKLNTLDDR